MAWTEKRPSGHIGRYRAGGKTKSTTVFKRQRHAQEAADAQEQRVKRGEWADPARGRVTIKEWVPEWQATLTVKPKTRETYDSLLRSLVLPRWSDVRLDQVTLIDVKQWVASITGDGGQTLSPSRVRQAHRLLATVLDTAVEDGRLPRNPAHSTGGKDSFLPRVAKQKAHRFLSHDEVSRLADATPAHYRPLIYMLAYTGLRWGEATALRVADVDMLRRRVQVSRSVADVKGALVYGTTKTHASRSVPFPGFIGHELSLRLEGRAREALLFTTPSGAPIRLANFRHRVFDPAIRDAQLLRLTPHDLRHTAASLAVAAGATVKGVQGMLGHQDASLTLNTYAGLFDDDLDDVAERLGAAAAHYLPTGRRASAAGMLHRPASDAV